MLDDLHQKKNASELLKYLEDIFATLVLLISVSQTNNYTNIAITTARLHRVSHNIPISDIR